MGLEKRRLEYSVGLQGKLLEYREGLIQKELETGIRNTE